MKADTETKTYTKDETETKPKASPIVEATHVAAKTKRPRKTRKATQIVELLVSMLEDAGVDFGEISDRIDKQGYCIGCLYITEHCSCAPK